jgi:hypothetical protein
MTFLSITKDLCVHALKKCNEGIESGLDNLNLNYSIVRSELTGMFQLCEKRAHA